MLKETSKPVRTTVNVVLDELQWYDFRVLCMIRKTTTSKEISRFIQHELAQWKKKEDEHA
jgi:hypothetical protein